MDEATHKKNDKPIILRDMFMVETGNKDKHYTLTLGKPIPYNTFDKRLTPKEWAQLVKDHIYIIAEDPEREFSHIQNSSPCLCQ